MADLKLRPIEAALLERLERDPGAVAPDEELIGAGWPDTGASRQHLHASIYRLRQKVGPSRIKRVRATVGTPAGYMLVPGALRAERGGLPPIQAALLRRLEQERGALVSCEELIRAGWPETGAKRSRLIYELSQLRWVIPDVRILAIRESGKLAGYVLISARRGHDRVRPVRAPIRAALLERLERDAGAVVPAEELIRAVWPDTGANPDNLRLQISRLRKRIGFSRIKHVPATVGTPAGYMLVPGVLPAERGGLPPIQAALLRRLEHERGALVSCEELIRAAWPETGATLRRLANQVSELRQVTPGARILAISEGRTLIGYVLTLVRAHEDTSEQEQPPIRAALLRRLEAAAGVVVPEEELIRAGWPDTGANRNRLHQHIHFLSKQVAPSRIKHVKATSNGPGGYMLVEEVRGRFDWSDRLSRGEAPPGISAWPGDGYVVTRQDGSRIVVASRPPEVLASSDLADHCVVVSRDSRVCDALRRAPVDLLDRLARRFARGDAPERPGPIPFGRRAPERFELHVLGRTHQQLTVSGLEIDGAFSLLSPGGTTGAIAGHATADGVRTALELVAGSWRVTCSGGPLPGAAVRIEVGWNVPLLQVDNRGLTGGVASISGGSWRVLVRAGLRAVELVVTGEHDEITAAPRGEDPVPVGDYVDGITTPRRAVATGVGNGEFAALRLVILRIPALIDRWLRAG